MSTPQPPENVRIIRPDGTEIPCELRYVGETINEEDGKPMHKWDVLSEYVPEIPTDRVAVGMLPARTQLSFVIKHAGSLAVLTHRYGESPDG